VLLAEADLDVVLLDGDGGLVVTVVTLHVFDVDGAGA
jgi:hypothetical protein